MVEGICLWHLLYMALLASNTQLARKLDALEKSVAVMDADAKRQFKELRAAVFALADPPVREQ